MVEKIGTSVCGCRRQSYMLGNVSTRSVDVKEATDDGKHKKKKKIKRVVLSL